ncbi:glycosyltransferase family 39 protein [Streptantibioticus parmotrematis]|uniref:glycosyltransferase family 39 protein n=1 Tax=Streptantibioticus parmotrematis TaxID=2873249 RepID=UPI0033F53AB1
MPAASETAGARRGNAPVPRQRGRLAGPLTSWPQGPAAWRGRYWTVLLPLFAAVAALTHLPSFLRPVWNPDEGFLATQAGVLAHGGTLYQNVVDRKPPLVPWLYEGLFGLFGAGSLWPVRTLAVVAHLATAALLASVARRRWGDRAGVVAGLGYLLVSIGLAPEDTQAATFEVFMLPWTAAAFWCADRRRWTLAGLAVAGAALAKQTGGAVLLPVVWMLWRSGGGASQGGTRRKGALGLAAGFVLPLAAVAVALGPGRFLFWTVTGSGSYATVSGSAWLTAAARGLGNAGILLVACAGLAVPVALLLRGRGAGRRFADADLWIWLAASLVAVVTGFQFYGHYYLQLLPPLVLLGTAALRRRPRWRRPAFAWTALAACGFLVWGLTAPRTDLDHAHTVAAAVRRDTPPGARVLVWGMHPEEYWLAGRAPASRFLTAGFLTNFSGGRGGAQVGERYAVPGAWDTFRREMADHPPALIVDDSRGQPYGPSRIPGFRDLLRSHYRPVGTTDGAVLYAPRR